MWVMPMPCVFCIVGYKQLKKDLDANVYSQQIGIPRRIPFVAISSLVLKYVLVREASCHSGICHKRFAMTRAFDRRAASRDS